MSWNGGNGAQRVTEEAWMHAIQQATKVLLGVGHHNNNDTLLRQLAVSMTHLNNLQGKLQEGTSDDWNEPPTKLPPKFRGEKSRRTDEAGGAATSTKARADTRQWGGFTFLPEHGFSDDDESDDDSQHHAPPQDRPDPVPSFDFKSNNNSMSRRRLLIRVMTAQSEVYACRASHMPPQWNQAADDYEVSLQKIHYALQLADSECALLLQLYGHVPDALMDDAQIVSVAIHYLTTECDKFRRKVLAEEQTLLEKLRPQWQARDEARAHMGDDRWSKNPNPSNRYAQTRKADEQKLRVVQQALQQLEGMDTETARASARMLQERVENGTLHAAPHGSTSSTSSTGKSSSAERYNGIRPTDISRRVSLKDYPDPAISFGWIFTGSHNNTVEFFERANQNDVVFDEDVVKLDWYFTTATIKTSLHHPTQGKTQLFGKRVSPEVYREVLTNPRAHTNVRYRKKKK